VIFDFWEERQMLGVCARADDFFFCVNLPKLNTNGEFWLSGFLGAFFLEVEGWKEIVNVCKSLTISFWMGRLRMNGVETVIADGGAAVYANALRYR
jgi:hypothetical protein